MDILYDSSLTDMLCHGTSTGLMPGQRRRRWPGVKPVDVQWINLEHTEGSAGQVAHYGVGLVSALCSGKRGRLVALLLHYKALPGLDCT